MEALLQVHELTVHYRGRDGKLQPVLIDLSFELRPRETLGLLGQSGCGKTTLALALLRLLPGSARIVNGSVQFRGLDILRAEERTLEEIRGAQASIIFQEPASALNPVMRVGDQIREVARAHTNGRADRQRAETALAEVGLSDGRVFSAYPHQLSSGQRQRVVIAQALICRPSLLIADEPTSALDNLAANEIITLLKDLKKRLGLALLFITHNPALLLSLADRLLIMQAGRFVEEGCLEDVYRRPKHLYTQDLLRSIPPLPVAPSNA